jgi:diguanylate cyclase (GGDEF)-like protein
MRVATSIWRTCGKAIGWLSNRSWALQLLLGLLVVGIIGMIDYLTGTELGLSIFYLAAIMPVAWTGGSFAGAFMSIVAALVWLAADLGAGHRYTYAAIPYWEMLIRLGFFLVVTSLLSRLRRALLREQELARIDSLTGVYNAHHFVEAAGREIERCRRHNHPLTMAYMDLDNFKAVNDSLGHAAGDALLQEVALTLRKATRSEDCVARLGGDEFAVLFVEADREAASVPLRRVQGLLGEAMRAHGWPVTFSIGAVTFAVAPASADAAIKAADELMYLVKANGKNGTRHEVVSEALRPAAPSTSLG